jgi:hypothetical protein
MKNQTNKRVDDVAKMYIAAKTSREFDALPSDITPREMAIQVMEGKVFELLLQEIEHRYCSMQSMLYAGIGLGVTEAYKKAVRKAFQDIFNEANNTKDVH